MKFSAFKQFRGLLAPTGMSPDAVTDMVMKYLRVDVTKIIRELEVGLTRLTFTENFDSFETTVTIPASSEIEIRNELRSKEIPTRRLIVRGGSGSQNVVDGDTIWTEDFVYLQNTGGSEVTVTVAFFRR